MRLLVFGKTGQVATELARRAPPDVAVTCLGRAQADLCDPPACAARIHAARADAVINAAAWTAVDAAETQEAAARVVNAAAPAAMARACAERGLPFLHLSTDYVFNGAGTAPWTPDAPTAPLGAYGRTKLLGEQGVRAAGGRAAILRTAWVFSAHGQNFVKTMLRLSATRDRLTVVADQVGGPTPAAALADALVAMARALAAGAPGGTWHFAGAPEISWAGFARAVLAAAGRGTCVTDIPSEDYPTPAPRPRNSRLDCTATETDFGLTRPDWRQGLRAVLDELGARA